MQNEQRPIVVFMSSYPPRECGIATFTADLVRAIRVENPSFDSKILALNDTATSFYHYPDEVFLQITNDDERAYVNTAEIINRLERVVAVNIEHEFGLFGGRWGSHLLGFVTRCKKPIVTTFHTVLPNPDDRQRTVVQLLLKKSKQCIVMTKHARDILRTVYGAIKTITIVPHGIPSITFEKSDVAKRSLGFEHNFIISTFGLLNAGKGIEYVLDALPEVVRRFPHVVYLVIGETHPVVRRKEGERYRKMLMRRVLQLRLEEHVKFYDRYLPLEEILQFLKATDVYIATSLDPHQTVSGTVSYAMGVGRPIIATPFAYAKEMVTPMQGTLVPFRDARAITEALVSFVNNETLRMKMGRNAYAATRSMLWSRVGTAYIHILESCATTGASPASLPLLPVHLRHMERLTDTVGMIQFAKGTVPDLSSGYTVDDNARALIVAVLFFVRTKEKSVLSRIRQYVAFLAFAQKRDGSFSNYVDSDKSPTHQNQKENTADANGRALWALGVVIATEGIPFDIRRRAEMFLKKTLPHVTNAAPVRTIAFALFGIATIAHARQGGKYVSLVRSFAETIVERYTTHASFDWQWFEPHITYANGVIPHALILAYHVIHNDHYRTIAKKTIDFLIKKTLYDTFYMPIGNKGWCTRDGRCAHFDQQPEDPAAMTMALCALYDMTKEEQYRMYALRTFGWFLGENVLRTPLYDTESGGCHDGLSSATVNPNEGAESTVSYLLARLTIEKYVS